MRDRQRRPPRGATLRDHAGRDRLARDAYTPQAEALFIPCTDFEAIDLIEVLERDLGVPVVTANQATMWHALRLSGVVDALPHFGTLYTLPDLAAHTSAAAR